MAKKATVSTKTSLPKNAFKDFCRKYPRASNTVLYITGIKRMVMYDRVAETDKKWHNFKNCVKFVHLRLYSTPGQELPVLGIGSEVYMNQEQRNQWTEEFWRVATWADGVNKDLKSVAKKFFTEKTESGFFDKMFERFKNMQSGMPF